MRKQGEPPVKNPHSFAQYMCDLCNSPYTISESPAMCLMRAMGLQYLLDRSVLFLQIMHGNYKNPFDTQSPV